MKDIIDLLHFAIFPKHYIGSSNGKRKLSNWSKEVRKRDKKCIICGSKHRLEAHHIKPKNQYPRLAFSLENGITICAKHHRLNQDSFHKIYGYKNYGKKELSKWIKLHLTK